MSVSLWIAIPAAWILTGVLAAWFAWIWNESRPR